MIESTRETLPPFLTIPKIDNPDPVQAELLNDNADANEV
jgi:hypothetical protein